MKTIKHKNTFFAALLLSGCFLMTSCKKMVYRPAELVRYVNDTASGFIQTKTLGEVQYSLNYLPSSYNALMEMGPGDFSMTEYQQLQKEYAGSYNFRFRMRHASGYHPLRVAGKEKEEMYMLKKYFDFDVMRDVQLIEGNDTVDCTVHHHFYDDMNQTLEVMFLFERRKPETKGSITVVYTDRLFNKGYVLFAFDKEVINFSPQIKQ